MTQTQRQKTQETSTGADPGLHISNVSGFPITERNILTRQPLRPTVIPVNPSGALWAPNLGPAHLPMNILAEASGQTLSSKDQVALVTKAIQQEVVLLILSIAMVMDKGHYVSLQQREEKDDGS